MQLEEEEEAKAFENNKLNNDSQGNKKKNKKKNKAREPPPAPPVQIETGPPTRGRGLTDSEIVEQCRQDVQKLTEDLMNERGETVSAALNAESSAVMGAHHQSLVAFSTAQVALALQTFKFTEQFTIHTEHSVNKAEALNQFNKELSNDLTRAQQESEKLTTLRTTIDNFATRAENAHHTVQFVVPIVETNLSSTVSSIAEADAEYKSAREALDLELQQLETRKVTLEQQAAAGTVTGDLLAAEKLRLSHEQAEVLSNLGDLSAQRLLSARELLESVKSYPDPGVAAEQASVAEECAAQAEESLQAMQEAKMWFETASQRIAQATAAEVHSAVGDTHHHETISATGLEERIAGLAAQLHACFVALEWVAAEAAISGVVLPVVEASQSVTQIDANNMVQRGMEASKKLSEFAQTVVSLSPKTVSDADKFYSLLETSLAAHAHCTGTVAQIRRKAEETSQLAEQVERLAADYTTAAEDAVYMIETQATLDCEQSSAAEEEHPVSLNASSKKRNPRSSLGAFPNGRCLSTSSIYMPPDEEEVGFAEVNPFINSSPRRGVRKASSGQLNEPAMSPLSARHRALQLVTTARATDERAEELAVEVEKIAAALQESAIAAERATRAAEQSASGLDAELTAMAEFKARADAVSASAQAALLATTNAAKVLSELKESLSASVQAEEEAASAELAAIQLEQGTLQGKMAEAEASWEVVGSAESVRLSQRAIFAQQSAELMERLHAVSARQSALAEEQSMGVKAQIEQAAVQEKASSTAEASAAAQNLRENFRTTEAAIGAAQSTTSDAEKVNAAAEAAIEAKVNARVAVAAAETAALAAAAATSDALAAIAEYETLGDAFQDKDFSSPDVVINRAQRCVSALQGVDTAADHIISLQSAAQLVSQHAATKCGQTVTARAVGYIALARASEAGQEAAQIAKKGGELEAELIQLLESAVAKSHAEVSNAQEKLNSARVAASEAERLQIAQAEREATELLLVNQQAAVQRACQSIKAATQAETQLRERTQEADNVALSMDLTLLEAQQADQSAKTAIATITAGLVSMQNSVAASAVFSNTINGVLEQTVVLASGSKTFQSESAAFITEADEAFASEHLEIEREAIELDYVLEDAAQRWEQESFTAVQKAAERLPLAVQGAVLMQQMYEAAVRKEAGIRAHLAQAETRSEAAKAGDKEKAALEVVQEAAEIRLSCLGVHDSTVDAARVVQQAAEQTALATQAAADNSAKIKAAVETAERVSAEFASKMIAVREAMLACEQAGAELPECPFPWQENAVPGEIDAAGAVGRVTDAAERIKVLNDATQETATQVAAQSAKMAEEKAQLDVNLTKVLANYDQIVAEAAVAKEAHKNTVGNAQAALQRAQADVASSTQATEESRFAVADAESNFYEAQTAEKLQQEADLLTQQQSAQSRAQELLGALQLADADAEKSTAELEGFAQSLEVIVHSVQETVSMAEISHKHAESQVPVLAEYQRQAEELNIAAENAVLAATLEANVAEEHLDASKQRIAVAEETLQLVYKEVQAALGALDESIREAELRWETENTVETLRAEERVSFAAQRAELMAKILAAAENREATASEHVALVKAHTEAVDAQRKAEEVLVASQAALSLQESSRFTESMTNAGQSGARLQDSASEASVRAAEVEAQVQRARVVALESAVWYAQTEENVAAAIGLCVELGAIAPAVDANGADSVSKRDARCGEAVRQVQEYLDQINALATSVKETTTETSSSWGKAVAAQALGDMAVKNTVEAAQEAARESARAQNAQVDMISLAEATLVRCCSATKTASEDLECAKIAVSLAERTCLNIQEQKSRAEAETLRLQQQAARNAALDQLKATKAVEMSAEELSFEIERLALTLEQTTQLAEEAAALATKSETLVEGECAAMEKFAAKTSEYKPIVDQALQSVKVLEERTISLAHNSTENISEANETYAGARSTFEQEAIHLHDAVEDAEEQWARDNVPASQQAAQRVAFALENAGLMLELFDAAVSRQYQAVEHVNLVRGYKETAEAEEQMSIASTAASKATDEQARAHSLETAVSAVKTSNLAADKVLSALKTAGNVEREVTAKVRRVLIAEMEASQVAATAKASVTACAVMGAEAPEFNVGKMEDTQRRAQRCNDAQNRVETCLARLQALRTATKSSAEQVTTNFETVTSLRAAGEANVAYVLAVADEVSILAGKVSAHSAGMVQSAEDALAQCKAEASACGAMEEASRVAAENANVARITAEKEEHERLAMEAAENERTAAESLAAKQLVAQQKIVELTAAWRAADQYAEELSFVPETLSAALEDFVQIAAEAASTVVESVASANMDWKFTDDFRLRAEDIQGTAKQASLAATTEARGVEGLCQALYKRIDTADNDYLTEQAQIDDELIAFDAGVQETQRKWQAENAPESVILAKLAAYAHSREELVAKKVAIVTIREDLAMQHLVEAGGLSVEPAEPMVQLAREAAESARALEISTEFSNAAASAAELSQETGARSSAVTQQASQVRDQVHQAVLEAAEAARAAAALAGELQRAVDECVKLGSEFSAPYLSSPLLLTQREERIQEVEADVNETVNNISELNESVQSSVQQTVTLSTDTETARSQGLKLIARTYEAAHQAVDEVARVRALEAQLCADADTALVRARSEFKPARQAVVEARTAAAEAEKARLAAEEAEALRGAAELLQNARSAADAEVEKQRAVYTNAKTLIEDAEGAESVAKEMLEFAEELAATLASIENELGDLLLQASAPLESLQGAVVAVSVYHDEAESLCNIAAQALTTVTARATAREESSANALSRIQGTDGTVDTDRIALVEELRTLDATVAQAEAQWHSEGTAATERTAQRAMFAKDRARLVSRMSALAAKQSRITTDAVTSLKQQQDARIAQEKASALATTAARARELQLSASAHMSLVDASQASAHAAQEAAAAAERAAECEVIFRTAVQAAAKASKAAALASSEAAMAVSESASLGVDGLNYDAPSEETQAKRAQRCSVITEQALDCVDRIQMLNATVQRAAQKVASQCALLSRTKEGADAFVSRTVDASSEATMHAAKATQTEREALFAAEALLEQARAEAKSASEDGKKAHMAAILAVQAHNSAHELESCCDTMSVGSGFTATSNATLETQFSSFIHTPESTSEDVIRAAQEAITTADENALAAERAAFALEHVLLTAEDVAMTAKGAVGVVHGELVYMEAFRADLERLHITAEKAQQAVSVEANNAQKKSDASAQSIKDADEELAAERADIDSELNSLNLVIKSSETKCLRVPETERAHQRAMFAKERADLLAGIASLLAAREQQAAEHLAAVKAHTELTSGQKKSGIAATTATVATNVQNETRTTEQASRGALTSTRCVEKTVELCRQAAEARENVRLAVQKSLKAAKSYEKLALLANNGEKSVEVPQYDLARRTQRCADAVQRVDENAERIEALSSTVKQSAEQATVQCNESVAARAAGDVAAKQTQDASREAATVVERINQVTSATIAAAEASLSWARIQAQSAAKESQQAATEAATLQANLARSQLSTQEAALATVNDLLSAARAAAAVAEEKTVFVEHIAAELVSTVRSAEEASMMAKGAVGLVHGELVYMEAYRKDAEAMASIISTPEVTSKKSPKNEQKQSAFVDSHYDTLAQRIASADESFANERAPLVKKILALTGTVAASEQRWRVAEEPEVNRATQRASFAQAKYKLLEKLAATAAARLTVAEKHLRYAKAQCEPTTPTSESVSGKSNTASVATDLQADTRTSENALQASCASQTAAQRAVIAAGKAAEAECKVTAAADAAKAATEKYLLAEKAARAAIAKYTANGIKVPEYDAALTDEVSLRTQRRTQAVKSVTESADYIAMLNDSAQLSSNQASEQYSRTVKERARGDVAIARVINPSSSADLANIVLAEEAHARCAAEAQAAEQAAAQAKDAAMNLRKSKVSLHSMSSRSNLGLFLKQEFGEVESHLVTGPVSVSPFSSSPVVKAHKSVVGPSEKDDPNAGSKVDQNYVQPIIPERGSRVDQTYVQPVISEQETHQAETLEIWNLTGEALERHRIAQEEEKAQAAREVAPIKRAQIYEVRRLQSKKRSFHVKELRKKRISTDADCTAEELEDKLEKISNDVEEALFAAEADVNIIAEAGAALKDQVTWMQDFQTKAVNLQTATAETLRNAKLFTAQEENKSQSPRSSKNLIHTATEQAHHGTQMCTWYTLELAHSAKKAVANAEARVARAREIIEAHIEDAEGAIETILEMYSAAIAPSPLTERAKSREKGFSLVRSHSDNTLSSLSDGEHEENDENSFVRNAKDVRRVLALAREMMHIASTRSKKLHENATMAYQQTVEAHEEANKTVRESIDAANVAICTVQQASAAIAPSENSITSADSAGLRLEPIEPEVYHSPEIMVSHSPFRYSYKNSSGETSPASSPSKLQQRFRTDFTDTKENVNVLQQVERTESKDDCSEVPINASIRSDLESIAEEKSTEVSDHVRNNNVSAASVVQTPIKNGMSAIDTTTVSPAGSAASTPIKSDKDPKSKKRHSLMSNMLGGLFSGKKDNSGKSAASSPMPSAQAQAQEGTQPVTPVRPTPPVTPVRRNSIAGAVLSPGK